MASPSSFTPNPSRATAEYDPRWGMTFIDNGDGSATSVHGDQTQNPMYVNIESRGPRLKPSAQSKKKMQAVRDIAVDAASQIPLMIPGFGLPARAAISLGTGIGADQLLNPEKSKEESTWESIVNTLVGATAEGLAGGTLKLKTPNLPGVGASVGGFRARAYLNLKGLSPIYRDPLAVRPGSMMLEDIENLPTLQQQLKVMGVKGAVSNAKRDAALAALASQKRDIIVKGLKDLGLYNLLPGVGANAFLDTTINKTDVPTVPQF